MGFNKYPYTDLHEMNLDWIIARTKELIAEWAETSAAWLTQQEAFESLKNYINTWFDNLDVQQEINNKIDDLVEDGTLSELIAPYVAEGLPAVVADQIAAVVADQIDAVVFNQIDASVARQINGPVALATATWLSDHVDPETGYVIDDSLTIQGAAADAKETGDQITDLKSALTLIRSLVISRSTTLSNKKVASSTGVISDDTNYSIYEFPIIPNLVVKGYTRSNGTGQGCAFYDENGVYISGDYNSDGNNWNYQLSVPNGAYLFRITCANTHLANFTFDYDVSGTGNIIAELAKDATKLDNALNFYSTGINTSVNGYYITSAGQKIAGAEYSYVEFPVIGGVTVKGYTRTAPDQYHGYAFYDASGNFISGGYNSEVSNNYDFNLTAPSNASIFRITCVTSYLDRFTGHIDNFVDVILSKLIAEYAENEEYNPKNKIFYCGSTRTLSTLKAGIEAATKVMDAILYVDAGTYDLVTEFGAAWFEALTDASTMSGLTLKNRIHVIFSPNSKVISNYTGDNQYAQSLYSPFNAGEYGFTLENLTIEASRCRYCVHDERNGATEQYVSRYVNCNMSIDNSENDYWTSRANIGGGLGSNAEVIVEGCTFDNDNDNRAGVYYHQSNDDNNANYKSNVTVKNNYFVMGCVQIDDARAGSTSGKTIYKVTNNSYKKYTGTNDEGVFVQNMTSPTSEVYAWNNDVRVS